MWPWNTKNGVLTTKLAYDAITYGQNDIIKKLRFSGLWRWSLPLKMKLLCWLMMENRILTTNNYIRKGVNGLNICLLCGSNVETVTHLMIQCPFVHVV